MNFSSYICECTENMHQLEYLCAVLVSEENTSINGFIFTLIENKCWMEVNIMAFSNSKMVQTQPEALNFTH